MSFLFSPWIHLKRKRPFGIFSTSIGNDKWIVVWSCLSRRPCFCCVLMISFLEPKKPAEKKAHSPELLLLQLLRIDHQSPHLITRNWFLGRFHDDFRSRIRKRALKLWTMLSTYVRNELFLDLRIGGQKQNSVIDIQNYVYQQAKELQRIDSWFLI